MGATRPVSVLVKTIVLVLAMMMPSLEAAAAPALPAVLAGRTVVILQPERLPLPYPPGFTPVDLAATGELYDGPITGERAFVPRDHDRMLQQLVAIILTVKGASVRTVETPTRAARAGAEVLVSLQIREFRVRLRKASSPPVRAEVRLDLAVFDAMGREIVSLEQEATAEALPDAAGAAVLSAAATSLAAEGRSILTVGEEEIYRPLRVLLAVAAHQAVERVLERLAAMAPGGTE